MPIKAAVWQSDVSAQFGLRILCAVQPCATHGKASECVAEQASAHSPARPLLARESRSAGRRPRWSVGCRRAPDSTRGCDGQSHALKEVETDGRKRVLARNTPLGGGTRSAAVTNRAQKRMLVALGFRAPLARAARSFLVISVWVAIFPDRHAEDRGRTRHPVQLIVLRAEVRAPQHTPAQRLRARDHRAGEQDKPGRPDAQQKTQPKHPGRPTRAHDSSLLHPNGGQPSRRRGP